jgi:hypothetical protein
VVLGDREASVPVATPSHNRGESLSQSHLQPPLRQVALRLKDARPCRILQCRYLSNLAGANSHRRSLSLLLTPRENRSCPKPLAIMRVPCCPCSRVAPCSPHPWRITASTRELSKVTQSCPRRTIRDWHFARPNIANGSARVKDPSLPQARPFTTNFSSSQCSCSRSSSKRLIVSTSDPMS